MNNKFGSNCSCSPQICGSCMLVIKDLHCLPTDQTSISKMLRYFYSELDMRVGLKLILCPGCFKIINSLYEFKQKSLVKNNSPYSVQNERTDIHTVNIKEEIKMEEIDLSEEDNANEQSKYVAITEDILEKHTNQHSMAMAVVMENIHKNTIKCSQCRLRPNSTSEKPCNCNKFVTKSILKNLLNNDRDKQFQCKYCSYTLQTKNVKGHTSIHTQERSCKCDPCYHNAVLKRNLNKNLSIVTEDKLFKCDLCNFSTNWKNSLKSHSYIHTNKKNRIYSEILLYKCSHCDYNTTQRHNLIRHIRIHTGEKPFKCDQCDYRCTEKSTLDIHTRIHIKEKPFKCDQCNFSTKWEKSLKKHNRFHATASESTNKINISIPVENEIYKCFSCNYSTSEKVKLKYHKLIHTIEKRFKCGQCDYSATQKTCFEAHVLIHTGEKPFKCFQCNFSTRWKRSLEKHKSLHTNDSNKRSKINFNTNLSL